MNVTASGLLAGENWTDACQQGMNVTASRLSRVKAEQKRGKKA